MITSFIPVMTALNLMIQGEEEQREEEQKKAKQREEMERNQEIARTSCTDINNCTSINNYCMLPPIGIYCNPGRRYYVL